MAIDDDIDVQYMASDLYDCAVFHQSFGIIIGQIHACIANQNNSMLGLERIATNQAVGSSNLSGRAKRKRVPKGGPFLFGLSG